MPTYEYGCRECGRTFDVFQKMSDAPVAPCPGCGRPGERHISGGAGLLFRGGGFYITDHRSESYRERAREETGVAAGSGADGGAKTGDGDRPKKPEKSSEASGKAHETAAAG